MRILILSVVVLLGVSACGGSSSEETAASDNPAEKLDYSLLKPAQVDSEPLVPVAGDAFSTT